ncbi:nicotinate-nucleotide--dimethylbenzimidazole phosphoribosyltransferase [Halioglobus japonicus]|uniref:Nicotinate-nucleotide--dimethylbenzimidazole phosphoribosyltransferase n=1 Tax=Halioglobus japonicus TaxID=930805 RepID=A0AAP8MH56_9GAMM|nr:nicotinate-nucleotide--dimethylbenzimidazole phosphoribosyltransferase [Halioglobus japonicus]AQA19191.1 nicotinate-nucleotide--dimethylbenzimidazole phosphoribosyltransferase [Halioglobus japonicus]PLW87773.1 nicotinate-nucleotide--dimethylbenzimidazole phosphoribosyltransferase [Halioglobus japonicus]GHD06648.1 nicotinate-nucleotide--dimethylbenzimidazole phosphoribosyltransferase [Halioglobus japonicus]
MNWYEQPCRAPSEIHRIAARQRQATLTKPAGSLGRLEQVAEQFAAWQHTDTPALERVSARIFAADHGITAQGVSAYPAEVTAQMITNFIDGGAAASVLCKQQNIDLEVINLGTFIPVPDMPGLRQRIVAAGTADFSSTPAMTAEQVDKALATGAEVVDGLDCQLMIAGDMGIGNTSAASALMAALLDLAAAETTGRGTGIDSERLAAKTATIQRALNLHRQQLDTPLAALQCLGGFEIAAMAGAYIRAAQRQLPSLVDGFISTAAALVASQMNPGVQPWLFAGHCSAENAHQLLLDAMQLSPLLQLDMRLGEGSGALTAVPLIKAALALNNDMASFAEAGIAEES